jgi:hypothetical protein
MNATKSKIEINEQILFSKDAGLFVGRITEIREKAVKVDYCFDSIWSRGVSIYTYCTWIPISVLCHDELGGLTVKKWFALKGLQPDKIRHIKKYFVENGQQIFI